jgi:hypothetical protein
MNWRFFVSILVILLIILGLHFAYKGEVLDDEKLKENKENVASFINEESYIIDQFDEDKISANYFIGQTQNINKKLLSFYGLIDENDIPEDKIPEVKHLESIIFNFSISLKTAESSTNDKSELTNQKIFINNLKNQI